MSFHDDPDLNDAELETRLRRIAAGPALEAPPSLYRRLKEVTVGSGARSVNGVRLEPVRLGGHRRAGLRSARALAALAAVLLIAVSTAGLLIAIRGPQPAATWTLRPDGGQGEWTGLQWHDITDVAGGIAGPLWAQGIGGSGTGGVVRWSGGFATMGGDFKLWLSSDGLTWKESTSGLSLPDMVSVRGGLLVAGSSSDGKSRVLSFTTDERTWTPVTSPFDVRSTGLTAGHPGVVAVHTAPNTGILHEPSDLYFTADARSWTHVPVPSEMAGAGNLIVTPFIDGFVATGEVPDPNGSIMTTSDAGDVSRYSDRAWISSDGLSWISYDPALPWSEQPALPWTRMQSGPLGAGDGWIYSTDGGASWLADHDKVTSWWGSYQGVSDGRRIILAVGSGARFYLSEGDGHWSLLQQGGDVGSLPTAGHLVLLPNGVLWIAGDRVYFGQGLSGVVPQGSLGPMTTPTPGVTHPPVLESAVPTAAATATLAPTPSAASFTTTGSSAAWTGLNWSAIPDTSPIRTPMTGFLQWSGGYVATAAPRQNEPTPAMWTSPDGQTWTQAPIRSAFVSAAPGGLLAIAVDPSGPYRPGVVWTSSDGTTWHDGGQSNLPGSLVSLAGTNAGLVATVDSTTDNTLTYSVFFSPDGIHWTAQGPTIQPINGQIPHVQSGSGRFFLMGMSGPLSDSLTKPRFVLDASTIKDRTLWSDDGRTWTECAGTYSGFAKTVLFGRDGLLLETNFNSTPGGSGMARSADGGKTWIPDDQFNPLGVADTSQQAGSIGPAGVIVSNGVAFLAVSDGAKASISYDGESWSPISWDGSAPTDFRIGNWAGFLMLPHGVIVGDAYGAAR